MSTYYQDPDPQETEDWLDSLEGVIRYEGNEKADYLLSRLTDRARSGSFHVTRDLNALFEYNHPGE